MTFSAAVARLGIDVVAIAALAYAIYFRRHRRRDLFVIYAPFNVGLCLAVIAMTAGSVGTGVGFGLFGVLSIVRLRSEPFSNIELAYFFAALVLALVCGLDVGAPALSAGLAATVVAAAAVIDHPRVLAPGRRTELLLELAFTDEGALRAHLAERLNAEIRDLSVLEVDFVRETTRVAVGYLPRPVMAPEETEALDELAAPAR